MTPAHHDDWLTIYGGDVREVLPELASDSVDCIVTSPPYWGLRDYGNEGQIGLERTPEEYVANMVAVFRELRRVLKPSGTCWLNLGDSYAGSWGAQSREPDRCNCPEFANDYSCSIHGASATQIAAAPKRTRTGSWVNGRADLKPKDLVGIPWRVAFALQADGWYLRSDIIWSKPNPMPESVTDRPTKSHEYLFLLTKSARYYFDADAVREAYSEKTWFYDHVEPTKAAGTAGNSNGTGKSTLGIRESNANGGRNIRSVWTIATRPYPGAHFAVFPPELPERCIKAGSSERGVCPECGAPWERVVETKGIDVPRGNEPHLARQPGNSPDRDIPTFYKPERTTLGWKMTCRHGYVTTGVLGAHGMPYQGPPPLPAVILDPFAGSGTTGMVANRLSRRAILIDLNPEYLRQQLKRNAQVPLGLTEGDAA